MRRATSQPALYVPHFSPFIYDVQIAFRIGYNTYMWKMYMKGEK